MELTYSIGTVTLERKYISMNNNFHIATSINNISLTDDSCFLPTTIYANFDDFFYLIDSTGHLYNCKDKLEYKTYLIVWNETKAGFPFDYSALGIETSDGLEQVLQIDTGYVEKCRNKSVVRYRKHKIAIILDDDIDKD